MPIQQTQCPHCSNYKVDARYLSGNTHPLTGDFYTSEQFRALQQPGVVVGFVSVFVLLSLIAWAVSGQFPASGAHVSVVFQVLAVVGAIVLGSLIGGAIIWARLGKAGWMLWKKTTVTLYTCQLCGYRWTAPENVTFAAGIP